MKHESNRDAGKKPRQLGDIPGLKTDRNSLITQALNVIEPLGEILTYTSV